MLVAIRPWVACRAYLAIPATIISASSASQAKYQRPPRLTSRAQPLRQVAIRFTRIAVGSSGGVEVVEARPRRGLLREDEDPLVLHHVADRRLGIEEVAELAGAHRADLHAGRVA